MRCSSCGKKVSDDEVVFDTTNVSTRSGGKYAYTQTAPIWLCPDCANYRQGTFRLIFWIVGTILALGVIGLALDAIF
jgi:hypothetical protein